VRIRDRPDRSLVPRPAAPRRRWCRPGSDRDGGRMTPVRIAVVGRGFGARVVAPVFADTEGCDVVDVVSARDDAAVRDVCARPDVKERPDADGVLHECTAEDAFVAWLRTDRGVSVTIDTTFVAPVNLPSRVTVLGADGVLELRSDHRITRTTSEGSEEVFRLD